MSLIERARGRVEEIRAKGVATYLRELRGSNAGSPQIPTLKEIREKGVLWVLEERIPRVREIRERGILAKPIVVPPTPPASSTPTTPLATTEVRREGATPSPPEAKRAGAEPAPEVATPPEGREIAVDRGTLVKPMSDLSVEV